MSRAPWKDYLHKPEVQQMLQQGASARDPQLDDGRLEERARDKRTELARDFGLHARISDVTVSREGDVRMQVDMDEDIAFDLDDLKELVINGVPLAGARLIEIRRNESGGPRVRAVISVNVDPSAVASLRSLPLSVSATTRDNVRLDAIKMA